MQWLAHDIRYSPVSIPLVVVLDGQVVTATRLVRFAMAMGQVAVPQFAALVA